MDFHKPVVEHTLKGVKHHEPMPHAVKRVHYEMPELEKVVKHTSPDIKMVPKDVYACDKHRPATKPIYGMIQLEMRN